MSKRSKLAIDPSFISTGNSMSRRRIQDVATRQRILERATEDGRKNEPRTEDTQLNEAQRSLLDESESFVASLTRSVRTALTNALNKIRLLVPVLFTPKLEKATIKRVVAEVRDRHSEDLVIAFEQRQQAWRARRAFEEENRRAPSSAVYGEDVFLFVSTLVLLILTEGVLNAFLFQEMQQRGWVGGLMFALGAGLANIMIALGAGYLGWRLIGHVKPSHRVLGILLTIIFMTAAFALHLALAELREAITHDGNAQIDFLIFLKPWRWFNYSSIPPFVLFAVGVATFVIAALKGRGGTWGIVSVYPGYDTVDRRFRKADAVLQDAKDNLKLAMLNAVDGERAKLRARHDADIARVGEIRQLAAEAEGTERTLRDSIAHEKGRQNIWQRMYRDHNRLVRDTPAPAYFDEYPTFDEWSDRLDLSELQELVATAESTLAENADRLAALEEETLREQVATIEGMLEAVTESERRAAHQVRKDDGIVAEAAE